ncbi:10845_t:CDS:1 [Gigaspora margarita]|uniref:10845_t:CDS:1 n=1 Tax=Gigaspora margarita TaxID=4874 RepID=A0ABM8VXG3_GIGMA|nr:10845_t:CDS:1 [Gigaspora margarita]
MCTNATNKLIINQQLVLDYPKIFFEKYAQKNNFETYIDKREIIYIVNINNNISIAIFLKCVLKRYLKEQNQQARFNICMKCGKFTYNQVYSKFSFGKFRPLGNLKQALPTGLITENINCCDEPNHFASNYLQEGEKVDLQFLDNTKMKLFFKTFIDWCRYKLYECEHENITVYNRKFKKINQFNEKDLFYYVNYFLKEEMVFNICSDCNKICINKKNSCGCKKIKCLCE